MRKHSLSRKIVLAYSLLATLAASLLTSGLYWQLRTVQRQEIRDRLLELLRLSAPQIDSDYLALTVTADSMKEPFYEINQERLQNIQAAVPSINHIYALRQHPDGQFVFVLDYPGSNLAPAPVGKPLQQITPGLKAGMANLKQPIVEPDLLSNPAGAPVLYGYAPIKNQFDRINGVLVIELDASSIVQRELQAGAIALEIFFLVLLLTLVVIGWLSQTLVTQPILQLNQASQQIASGQWNQRLPCDRTDELGDLAASFNTMAQQLRESFTTLEQRVQERTAALQESEEKFRLSEQNLRTIFNHVSSYIFVHTVDGFLLNINNRVLERFGVEREQALKLSILDDYSASDNPFHLTQDYWSRALAGELVRFEWKAREISTGHSFDVDISLNRIIWDGRLVILADVVDVSERKQAALRLQRQAEADQLLATIAQTINQSVRLDEVLDVCLEQIRQFLRCDRVIITRFEANFSNTTILEAISTPELSLSQYAFEQPHFAPEWFESLRQEAVIVWGDVQTADLPLAFAEFLTRFQVRAEVVVPILQADQVWGLLIAHQCDRSREWQSLEINLLKQLGLQIGTASQKSSLYTQLENQLAQKEVLLKEIHHRIKNNLQVISSMLWLQTHAVNHPVVSKVLEDTRHRLRAMSLIHETLYQYGNVEQVGFHDYIQRLANSVLAVYSPRPGQITLHFHLQPVAFSLETAMPCGLLLNELVTNAIKHGFANRGKGEVWVSLEQVQRQRSDTEPVVPVASTTQAGSASARSPAKAVSRYILTVQDNGVGMPETLDIRALQSLGLKIAYDLALQLEGNLELERLESGGTRFRLSFAALEYVKRF